MQLLLLIVAALACLCLCNGAAGGNLQANVGELFTYKIEPHLFNWTHQVISEQFSYRPTMRNYPDLPTWMRYEYSHEYHAGFLYGTPPETEAGKALSIEVIALNRQNFETRITDLAMSVCQKFPTPNVVQMKIDNLNWVHLMDPGRVENLRNIFRKDLWPSSKEDLSVVFMESAVNMGGRLPLRPQQREGLLSRVIVHVGSVAQFSPRLKELQEEVRPLYKLPSCTYKRTSVQKIFENVGFKLDWCAFKMVGLESPTEILYHSGKQQNEQQPSGDEQLHNDRWMGITREDVPRRNYIDEFAFAFAIPGMIFAILIGMLSAVLCFQHQKFSDPHSEFFFANIFHICEESCAQAPSDSETDHESESSVFFESPISSTVQMVKCADQPLTTLKSLKDPNFLLDNTSIRSQSPSNSFYQLDCGAASSIYPRPKPPPYTGGTLGRNGVDI
ncbi:epsilon-sarcoglycan isoform X1 [Drosophila miranda]|uniref:epsilon-sarcoglycan isoform X1 n=1 Tax=Drosophila miranda TaxID=7229 RepID=UPI00143FB0B2|nr:epsilon-sarcoglycan isoform X1 [Drosophila miranda]